MLPLNGKNPTLKIKVVQQFLHFLQSEPLKCSEFQRALFCFSVSPNDIIQMMMMLKLFKKRI